jgi:hypothetical protein
LEIIALLDDFTMQHVSMDENTVVNNLAQQASSFQSNRGKFYVMEKLDVLVCQMWCSSFVLMQGAKIHFVEPDSAKPDGPVSETGCSKNSRNSDNLSEMTKNTPDTLFREP